MESRSPGRKETTLPIVGSVATPSPTVSPKHHRWSVGSHWVARGFPRGQNPTRQVFKEPIDFKVLDKVPVPRGWGAGLGLERGCPWSEKRRKENQKEQKHIRHGALVSFLSLA